SLVSLTWLETSGSGNLIGSLPITTEAEYT
ncbi:uncharacterized protein METZ01_LOCUS226838, partial [marine metagenome]